MADIHKYKFLMTGDAYNEGWERIFGSKKNDKGKVQDESQTGKRTGSRKPRNKTRRWQQQVSRIP